MNGILPLDTYAEAAMRTAKQFPSTTFNTFQMDMLHAALGVGSDAGELVDAIKKHLIYGKPLDYANVIEEIGDVMWFLALMCQATGTSLTECATENIKKLAKRYPEKYSDEAAIARADKAVAIQHEEAAQMTRLEVANWGLDSLAKRNDPNV